VSESCPHLPRQAEETSGLVDGVVEIDKASGLSDDVEQIAMFARRGVSLMFNCT